MVDRKIKFSILSYFQKRYKEKTGRPVMINKYAAQWDADALVESYGADDIKAMIDRYLQFSSNPSWKGFCRDSHKVFDAIAIEAMDREERSLIKKKVGEWLNE